MSQEAKLPPEDVPASASALDGLSGGGEIVRNEMSTAQIGSPIRPPPADSTAHARPIGRVRRLACRCAGRSTAYGQSAPGHSEEGRLITIRKHLKWC